MKTRRPARRLARKVSEDDHSRGSPLARTTLVAYGDFASPTCAQTYRTVKTIQRRLGTRLRYVYRSFPQPEQYSHSNEAAEAAECASSQGRFWEMHDSLFDGGAPMNDARLSQRASDAGLDLLRFRREMGARVHAERVQNVQQFGRRPDAKTLQILETGHSTSARENPG